MRRLAPSLRRRVVLALLLAFCLVGAVLATRELARMIDPDQLDRVVADFSRGVMAQLDKTDDPAEARGIVEALESQINRGYAQGHLPTVLAMQLWSRDGTPVHGSSQGVPLPARGPAGSSRVELQGRTFHVYRAEDARWRIAVAQPEVERGWIVRSVLSDLLTSLAIAFPLVLIPLWVAVSQGLRPLSQLSQRLAARDPDDLSQTGLAPRHAELRPLVQAVDGLLERLRGKVRREHAFVHDAAHELRTPLALISAQAHVLAHAGDAQARADAAARLDDAIARASNLSEQLLRLARFDSQAPARETMDVARLAQQEVALLAPRAIECGLELGMDAPDTLPWPIELAAFRAILQNLVGNAIRYVPAGGQVAVELAVVDDAMLLGVQDDGHGIDVSQRENVFERFARGAGHDAAGSGLGLAIVRQAARALGGSVRLVDGLPNTRGGHGCRFEVRIPR